MNELYRKKLKYFRKQENKTQLYFSEFIGISNEFYANIEQGSRNPGIELHALICEKLKKPSDCFFDKDKTDIHMSPEQFKHLMSLSQFQLSSILAILQSIYENTNAE